MSRASDTDAEPLVAELVSYAVGCVLGRWDVRFATGGKPAPTLPDPFDPLPVCSPGMLQEADGLPATQNPHGYPLRIDWDGILVDDPDHSDDIIRRVRDVLEVIWKERSDSIEKEACEILGVTDLRDYFRKPGAGGFWDDHVKRYSKSRRKAPIYCCSSRRRRTTPSGSTTTGSTRTSSSKPCSTTSSPRSAGRNPASKSCGPRRPPSAPPPRGQRSSTRTSTARRHSSLNCGTLRTSSARRRTSTSSPTSMTAWS